MNLVRILLGCLSLIPGLVAAQSSLPILISKRLASAGLEEDLRPRFVTNRGASVLFTGGGTNVAPDGGNVLKRDIYIWNRIAGTTERLGLKEASGTENGYGDIRAVSDDLRYVIVGDGYGDGNSWSRDRLSTGWRPATGRQTLFNGHNNLGVISRDGRVAQTELVTLTNGSTINRLRVGTVPGSTELRRFPLKVKGIELSIRFAQISSDGAAVSGMAIYPGNEYLRATGYVFRIPLDTGVANLIPVEALPSYFSSQCVSRNGRYFVFYGAFGNEAPWLHLYDFVENRWKRLFRENPPTYEVKSIRAISDSANLITFTASMTGQQTKVYTQELATGKVYSSENLYASWSDSSYNEAISSPDGEYLVYNDNLPPRLMRGFILNHRRSNKWWRYEEEFGEGGIPTYNPIVRVYHSTRQDPQMSEDGTRFAWISNADDIAVGDTNPLGSSGGYDLFFSDLRTGRRVCVTSGVTPKAQSPDVRMDYAGRTLVFSTNGYSGSTRTDIYVYDTATNVRRLVALDARHPAISGDGKVITYVRGVNPVEMIYRQDLVLGIETVIAKGWRPEMDGTGLHMAFNARSETASYPYEASYFRNGLTGRILKIFSHSLNTYGRSLFVSRDGLKFASHTGEYFDYVAQRRIFKNAAFLAYADPDLNYGAGFDYESNELTAFKLSTGRPFPMYNPKKVVSEGLSEQVQKLPYMGYGRSSSYSSSLYRVSLFTSGKPIAIFTPPLYGIGDVYTVFRWKGYDDVTMPDRVLFRTRENEGAWSNWSTDLKRVVNTPANRRLIFELQAKDEAGNESVVARQVFGSG